MSKKILIVDDEPDIVDVLEMRLMSEGYDIITAVDGQEGLSKAQQENPDLIVLDVMMPKMDGMKVCALLKADQRYKKIPIILLTAKVLAEGSREMEEVGAEAYLNKPFDKDILLETIKKLLGE